MITGGRNFTIGTPLYQTTVVFTRIILSTKWTPSFTQFITKINARALRHQFVGESLVSFELKLKQKMSLKYNIGYDKAKIEFNYKDCCNDGSGLQALESKVFQPSSCSQRMCYFNDYLAHSLWLSKQVIKTWNYVKIHNFLSLGHWGMWLLLGQEWYRAGGRQDNLENRWSCVW